MNTNNKKTNRLLKSRKAVSPLIATVLLIAFAVALGAVVMNWGRGYVEDTANMARERSDTEVTCASEVGVDLVDIDNTPQICYNSTGGPGNNATLEFILENKQSKTIEKLQVRLIGSATRVPVTLDINESLSTNQAKFMNVSYNADDDGADNKLGDLQQVKFTPYIRSGGSDVACPSSAETATTIKACSEVW